MSKPMKVSPAYIRAAIRRQRYLDFLNDKPGAIAAEIEKHMSETYGDHSKTTNTTRMLITLGEARCVNTSKANYGFRYFPIATVTTTAEEMCKRHRDANDTFNKANKVKDDSPGKSIGDLGSPRYVHKPTHTHNSGGQGAIRQRVYVGASWGVV